MISDALDKQFVLSDDGQIMWQKDLTDPRPGVPVAKLVKGDALTAPNAVLLETLPEGIEAGESHQKRVQEWIESHIREVLAPLFALKDDSLSEPTQDVAEKIFDALGIINREEIRGDLAAMEENQRMELRPKKIRFGPIIIYLPELNKPACVNLKAALYNLWHGKDLPASKPADGIVSFTIDPQTVDRDFYFAVGYPVYGPRAIRVDMLDRVICLVYDSADKGRFRAQHQMAEWLGCNIEDLYRILEDMGHRKVEDPAESKSEEKTDSDLTENASNPEESSSETAEKGTVTDTPKAETPVKPELALFILKSNAANKRSASRGREGQTGGAINQGAAGNAKKVAKFKSGEFHSGKKSGKKPARRGKPDNEPRVYTAEAKKDETDNPFAVLKDLNLSKKN